MGRLEEAQLKKAIQDNTLSGCYLFYGEEHYLKYRALEKLSAKVSSGESLNLVKLSWPEIDYPELVGHLENFPMAGGRKCVILQDCNAEALTAEELKRVKALLADIPPYAVFVMVADVSINLKKDNKWKQLIGTFDDNGWVVEFSRMTTTQLVKLLVSRAAKYGVELSRPDAQVLIGIVGNDLQTLLHELEKLCLSVGQGGRLDQSVIRQATPQTLERSVFDLSKCLLKRDFDSTFRILGSLLDAKEEPVAILAVLTNAYLDLYRARVLLNCNGNMSEVAKAYHYRGTEFRLKNAQRDTANLSMERLRNCLEVLVEADVRLKSSQADKRVVLEECIVKLGLQEKTSASGRGAWHD